MLPPPILLYICIYTSFTRGFWHATSTHPTVYTHRSLEASSMLPPPILLYICIYTHRSLEASGMLPPPILLYIHIVH